jgi:hypothetical protein
VGGVGSLVQFARPELVGQIERARRRIWLVSPYITGGVANEIAAAAERSKARERWLITELDERSVRSGVLCPEGLLRLREADFEVMSLAALHAKVSVVDNWGLIGSGNLTERGLGPKDPGASEKKRANVELGVILTPPQLKEATQRVKDWQKAATELDAKAIKEFVGLPLYPRPKTQLKKAGKSVGVIGTETLKKLLEGPFDPDLRYWLDPNYHDRDNPRWWDERRWVSDRRDAGIKKGDLIVIYLGKKYRGPGKCPAVVRALGSAEKKEAFLRRERDSEAAKRWPWVTEIELIADVPATDGVPLDVIGSTGGSLQVGPREITREEFETLAWEMVARPPRGAGR